MLGLTVPDPRRHTHDEQCRQHGQITKPVEQKTIPFILKLIDKISCNRRPNQSGGVNDRRTHRDRIRQVLATLHQIHHKRLPCRHIERVDHALKRLKHDDLRDGDDLPQGQIGQRERLHHRKSLRDFQNAMAVKPIDPHAAERGEEKNRDLRREIDDTQHHRLAARHRLFRQPIHQPTGGGDREPGPHHRNELTDEVQAIVAGTERAEKKIDPCFRVRA